MPAINSRESSVQSIVPRLESSNYAAQDLAIRLEGTELVVDIIEAADTPKFLKNYEVKLLRTASPGTRDNPPNDDWWNITWNPTNMLKIVTTKTARFNLLSLPSTSINPRISQAGVNYRIICRAFDTMGNISSTSIFGSILIKTITM